MRIDGTIVEVEAVIAPLGDGSVQLVVRDITDRKRAEAALRDSEERLTLAFAGAREGVWDWNLETGAVVYSSRWKQMLGYADDEIEPHVSAWERLLHPDDRPRADRAARERRAAAHGTYEGEFRLRHKDGHYIHVLSRGFPVRREPGGPVVRIVGTHLDITERKRDRSRAARERRAADARVRRRAGRRLGLEPRNRRRRVFAAVEADARLRATTKSSRTSAPGSGCCIPTIEPRADAAERQRRARAADLRRRVPPAAQGRPLRPRAVARLSGPPRTRRPGRPHRRHALRPHRAATRARRSARARSCSRRLVFAQEDERRRIAREMHDQFGEQLTALAPRIAALKDACADRPGPCARTSNALDAVAQQLDRDVDHLVWELRPTALDDLGLRAALANYVQDWSARVGIAAELHTSGLLDDRLRAGRGNDALPHRAGSADQRREALARAANVEVILERRADHVLLIVEDDGVGFDPARRAAGDRVRPAGHAGARRAGRRDARDRIGGRQGTTFSCAWRTPVRRAAERADHA